MATTTKAKAKKEETEEKVEKKENPLELLAPSAEPKEWQIGEGDEKRTYVQKPLSFLAKMRLFAHVGGTLRSAMAAGDPGAVTDLISNSDDLLSGGGGIAQTEAFLSLATSLAMYVPDFLQEAFCIILNVPPNEKALAIQNFNKSVEEGGLSDDQAIEIVQVFVAQNWGAIEDFFNKHLPAIWTQIQSQQEETEEQ